MAGNRAVQAIGSSYHLPDRKQGVARTVNLMLTQIESQQEDKEFILEQVPGWPQFTSLGASIRGAYSTGDRLYAVHDNTLSLVSDDGTLINVIGLINSNSGFVSMRHNGANQLGIVDGLNYYVLNLNTNVLTLVAGAFRGSDFIEYLDGYFIFVDPDTEQFYITAIDDATSLDALDFSSADKQPDNILRHIVFKGELYFFGSTSTEVWVNSGGADFPFARYNATPIDVGIVGKRAVTVTSDALVWVGKSANGLAFVYAMSDFSPKRISNRSVEVSLQGLSDLSQCVLWSYAIAGNEVVAVEHPDLETTWCFDIATREWHERARGNPASWSRLAFDQIVFHKGQLLAVSNDDLLRLDRDSNKIESEVMVRERTWPHLTQPSLEPITYRSLEVACSTGEGGQCYLRISNDGGSTWGATLNKSLGAVGRWMERVRWHFLGTARDRVFAIGCSDDVRFNLHSVALDAS
jgi:hypothetical protein